MITAQEVVKELCKMGLTGITVEYDDIKEMLSFDLNTGAKSGLLLFEDFTVEGRYSYTNRVDSDQEMCNILKDLYWEFNGCIHGRDYYNTEWKEIGVKLGILEKKVETHTTTSYV